MDVQDAILTTVFLCAVACMLVIAVRMFTIR